jgi:2'-hydroxyisoflavone reductase
MATSRREFLERAALGAACLGLAACASPPSDEEVPKAARRLRLLILGGSGFIGPPQVRYALARGHEVTIFNRGQTNPGLFPQVENLIGDRTGDLESLKGRTWDAVIDNSASTPSWVKLSAELLKDAARTYLFTSTRSVYSDYSKIGMQVDGAVYTIDPAEIQDENRLHYGLRKSLCEQEARAAFGTRALIVRPGLIVGPGDPTDRFTYWPVRIERGAEVLAPGDGSDPCMYIDARDLSEWYIHLLEQDRSGTYNAVGPDGGLPIIGLLYGIRSVVTSDVHFTWVDTDFLTRNRVRSYTDMPLWVPAQGNAAGFARFDIRRELEAGLKFRPLAVTARETLAWHAERPEEERRELKAGLRPEREVELLTAWRARS